MGIEQMRNERTRGTRWAKSLAMDDVHMLVDAMVLGEFDWRDWLDERPSAAFVNAAFATAQLREEMAPSYEL